VGGHLVEAPVAAAVIAVAVRVDGKHAPVRELRGRRPDVRDPEPRVDEDRPLRALDQEAVDMTGLTDQPGAWSEFFEREPGVVVHREVFALASAARSSSTVSASGPRLTRSAKPSSGTSA